jgi:hypothetical protein
MNGKVTPLPINGNIQLQQGMEIHNNDNHGVMLKVKFF